MKVYFQKDEEPQRCLVSSQISWDNPTFEKSMIFAFGVQKHEKIQRIIVDNWGIKAYFETIKEEHDEKTV